MSGRGRQRSRTSQNGVLYLGLLFFIALIGLGLSMYSVVWSTQRQREKEAELIAIGNEIRDAISSYYENSPGTVKRYPGSLDELIRDDRFLYVRRHLRRVWPDPMTGEANWKFILAPSGGIMGVQSGSTDTAYKQFMDYGNLPVPVKIRHSDWKFIYRPTSDQRPNAPK